jgi:RNA polymerase sigma factor (sigma-70 family)
MISDAELLRRYAESGSESAFAEFVRRNLSLVYFAALRRTGDAHLAEDIAQDVFTTLAQRAPLLSRHAALTGWLYTTTRHTAANAVRTEHRRKSREQEGEIMGELFRDGGPTADWERLRPVIDQALDELDDRDREAVLMRCLQDRPFAEIGAALRLNEDTARKRVERALIKLRAQLEGHGVTSTTTALAVALANQAGIAAPAGLAASVTGAAMAGSSAIAASWLATFMGITKLQVGIVGALVTAGGATYVRQARTNDDLRQELALAGAQQRDIAALRRENQQLAAVAAEVDTLRQDDIAFKQLARRIDEVKKANEEKARLAQNRAKSLRNEMADKIRADDQRAQVEIDRMNREGNALVVEFKVLSAQAKNALITPEARDEAESAAKAKLEAIKSKRDEIRIFTENVRNVLSQRAEELRRISGDGTTPDAAPPTIRTGVRQFEIQRVPATSEGPGAQPPAPGELKLIPSP